MKKIIIVALLVLISVLGIAQFKYLEPDILPNGVGKFSIGFDTFMRYGILDIVEVGLSPQPYIKFGMQFSDFWASVGYGYFPSFADFYESNTIFTSVGYYPDGFSTSISGMYSENEEWTNETMNPTLTEVRTIAVIGRVTLENSKKNGDMTLSGGYSLALNNNEQSGFVSFDVGSNFEWDWWIFRNIYIYGGLGANFPFKDLRSIVILGGLEGKFQFFK
ncbi:MAG: hypothetical protein FXF54_11370 [Kosmotoga sp.]|nr:MAG: hypothetical protein FXF54_11370 [Kosmotoga sp.]